MLDDDTGHLVAVTPGFGLFFMAGKPVLSRGKSQPAVAEVDPDNGGLA